MSSSETIPPKELRPLSRFITTTRSDGKADFSNITSDRAPVSFSKDLPVHFSLMYTLSESPPRVTRDVDIKNYLEYVENAPSLTIPGGVVGRICDYPPGFESPMHRTLSVDFGIVIEGEIELILDSGERRLLKSGDVAVQRSTMHAWKNVTPDEIQQDGSVKKKWARMFYVLIDSKPAETADGTTLEEDLGDIPRY